MTLLRTQLGNTLRGHRLRQRRTLRDVSGAARVSLGYLSEVERGQKEASSELLASICDALELELADLLAALHLREVAEAHPGGTGDVAQRAALTQPVATQGVPELGAQQRHGRLLSCERGKRRRPPGRRALTVRGGRGQG